MPVDFEREMDALRRDYLAGLPAQMGLLLAAPPAEAARLAHAIRGTAGSCGLHEIGAAAGQVEDALLDGAAPEEVAARIASLRALVPGC